MNEGTTAVIFAAVILGFVGAVGNVGASRVFWAIFGYELGKRKAKHRGR